MADSLSRLPEDRRDVKHLDQAVKHEIAERMT